MQIVIVLYDRFTALDAVGPYQVLSSLRGAEVVFAAEQAGRVSDDERSLYLSAEAALADVPNPDILVVPGGPGQHDQMDDGPLHDWLRAADQGTTWTTSVCTGSLVLAGAGLLNGRRATSHWLALGELGQHGAVPVSERVVFDEQVRDRGGRVGRHRHGPGPGRPDRGRRSRPGHPARHRVRPPAPLRRRLPGPRSGRASSAACAPAADSS